MYSEAGIISVGVLVCAGFQSFTNTSMPAPESVVLETSLGNIQLELYWDHAPRVCSAILITSKTSSINHWLSTGRPVRISYS